MNDDKKLQIISTETKKTINDLSVVTPSIYNSIFTKFAQSHDAKIDDEKKLTEDFLELNFNELLNLQNKTAQNVITLSDSTSKAINAIQKRDDSVLNEVLVETKALREEIEKLKESLYKDELTNVHNRKWLHDHYLDHDTRKFLDGGILAILDLNYFKLINDTHGHILGDKVLIFIALELKKSGYDVIRYGGDEFIIIFPTDVSENKAKKILLDIREFIITKKLKANNTKFRTSFSVGLTSYKSDDELSKIIEIADKNMYEDKIEIKKRITGIEV